MLAAPPQVIALNIVETIAYSINVIAGHRH